MDQPSNAPPLYRSSRAHLEWEREYKNREITANEWEKHRETFTQLYLNDDLNLGLTEVRRIMAERHGFYANETQFKHKIKKWGLEKNLKKETVSAMLWIQDKRALKGKSTKFKYKGRLVGGNKLGRSRKRMKIRHTLNEKPESLAAALSHVEYSTPSPMVFSPEGSGAAVADAHFSHSESTHIEISSDAQSPQNPSTSPMSITGNFQTINLESLSCGRGAGVSLVLESRNQESPSSEGFKGLCKRCIRKPDLEEQIKGGSDNILKSNKTFEPGKSGEQEKMSSEIAGKVRGAVWMSWGSGMSVIGSWIKNDIIMSGLSPFNFNSPSVRSTPSHPKPSTEFHPCCGDQITSVCDLIGHYENHQDQYQRKGTAPIKIPSPPPKNNLKELLVKMPDLKNTIKDHPLTHFREIPDPKSTIKDHRLTHFRGMPDVVGKEPTKSDSDWTGGKHIDNNRRMRSEDASSECLRISKLEKDLDALYRGMLSKATRAAGLRRPMDETRWLSSELDRRKKLECPSLSFYREHERLNRLRRRVRVLLEELRCGHVRDF